eukprot:11213121-Lingulodinium_polyedra.AAC.1
MGGHPGLGRCEQPALVRRVQEVVLGPGVALPEGILVELDGSCIASSGAHHGSRPSGGASEHGAFCQADAAAGA